MKSKSIDKAANLEIGQTVLRNWDENGREMEGNFEITAMRTCESGVLITLKDDGGEFDCHVTIGAGQYIAGFKVIKDRPRQMSIRA